ncbi:hypothetical protein G4D82_11570 [Flavobacterium sp. CYK-4]|nr:hypothetical protein [Flavobacterium lotistagni]NHM07862.1 hypothetical protein [Flavobacterium lotistagni]
MSLTFKIHDQENERINNILKRLIGLDGLPQVRTLFLKSTQKSTLLNL